MAHFAKVINGIVTQVIVAEADVAAALGSDYIQTSYNTHGGEHPQGFPLRKNFAGVGYAYDADRDAFIPPQPFTSWTLNEDTCLWDAPVPRPTGNGAYSWNENTQTWDAIPNEIP
jgi:hypothetical protein